MTRTPIWSVTWVSGSVKLAFPSTVRAAYAANDATLLARPVTVR